MQQRYKSNVTGNAALTISTTTKTATDTATDITTEPDTAQRTIGGRCLPLYSPSDEVYLSPLVCFVRSQLEVFSATEEDVRARAAISGLAQPISLGRVGIRCIHCRDATKRAKGAVSYPASIRILNQTMRNYQRFHLMSCTGIPQSCKEQFERLKAGKKANSTRKSQEYWVRRSGEMGLVDATGSRERIGVTPARIMNENEQEWPTEGIYFSGDAQKLGMHVLTPDDNRAARKKKEKITKASTDTAPPKDFGNETGGSKCLVDMKHKSNSIAEEASFEGADGASRPLSPGFSSSIALSSYLDDLSNEDALMSDLDILMEDDDSEEESSTRKSTARASPNKAAMTPETGEKNIVHGSSTLHTSGIAPSSAAEKGWETIISTLEATREVILSLREKHGENATALKELSSLGKALYKSLANQDENVSKFDDEGSGKFDIDNQRLPKRERRREQGRAEDGAFFSLQDLDYPTNVSIFVQSLIDSTDEYALERFISLPDVENDLQLMLAFPHKYISHSSQENWTGKLKVSSKLYGIQTQQTKLMDAFDEVIINGKESHGLALISGRSGSGKTSLVESLNVPLGEQRGKLIQIKFDREERQHLPMIFRAFDQYCQDLQEDDDLFNRVGKLARSALGPSRHILLSQMSNLAPLIGGMSAPPQNTDDKGKYHLLVSGLRAFVGAISAPSHPVVILFDDLQWACSESLDLINKLVIHAEARSCLFVGCYRDNEIKSDHPLLEYLGEVTMAGIPLWHIPLKNIEFGDINEFLSDTLNLLPRITAPLAKELHKKTHGNPHFVKQLTKSLCDEQLLQYLPSARRWSWNISTVRSTDIPDNAVALVLERMTQYGHDVQRVLQIAALIGRRFDVASLQLFQAGGNDDGDGSAIFEHIDRIVDDGLVCVDKASLRFAHDSIWEAAASLTPPSDRKKTHLLVGRQILRSANCHSQESLDMHLQLIVDQMNLGSCLIESQGEKLRLAELNLQVGKNSMASSSFFEASTYLRQASFMLFSEDDWNAYYNLCLEIYTNCAEAQLAHGSYEGAFSCANSAILHGKCFHDKLRAHYTIFIASYLQGEVDDASQKALVVLDELGVQLPSMESKIDPEVLRSELGRTEALVLSSFCADDIITGPVSTDDDITLTFKLKFLHMLYKISFVRKPDLMPLVVCRMMQLITGRPLASELAFAFGSYASLLCIVGLRDRSAECAQLAMSFLSKFQSNYPHEVLWALNITIQPYHQPWQACLDTLERASREGTESGDLSSAFLCTSLTSPMHIFAPVGTLQNAREKLEESLQELSSYGHFNFFIPMLNLQMLYNLSTKETMMDPTDLRGKATKGADILSAVSQSSVFFMRLKRKADFSRLFLGYVFRRHDVMIEMAECVKEHLASSKFYLTVEFVLERFYLGLTAFSISRRGGCNDDTDKWLVIADDIISEMKSLSENESKWNFRHKYLLLLAEKSFTDGDVETAAASYEEAIEASRSHRFINEEALANECAGLFYLDHGNGGQARKYLEQSRELYMSWGAHQKVDQMQSLLGNID